MKLLAKLVLVGLLASIVPANCSIIYVKQDSFLNGPGNDWDHAFHTISSGINAAVPGDEIRVAKGAYVEGITLKASILLKGGYLGAGDTRDTSLYPTTIDRRDQSWSTYAVKCAQGTTVDGFIVRGASDGIVCDSCSATVTNNVVAGNVTGILLIGAEGTQVTGNRIVSNIIRGVFAGHGTLVASNIIAGNGQQGILFSSDGTASLLNNTICANRSGIECSYAGSCVIANNIVTNNDAGVYCHDSGPPSLTKNNVFGNRTNYSGVAQGSSDISVDPQFASYTYGDLHIRRGSPCKDAGDKTVASLPTFDIDGQARVRGSSIDIGADESYLENYPDPYPARVVYVSASAPAGGDGRSWATAYQTPQEGVDDSLSKGGADVWVAKGTYVQEVSMRPFAHMYGGFAGTESVFSSRDPKLNETIIDANNLTASHDTVTGASAATIDGFTVRGGDIGLRMYASSPLVRNNLFTANRVQIKNDQGGSPIIEGNTLFGAYPDYLSNNTGYDSGIYSQDGAPVIRHNTFAQVYGAITVHGGAAAIERNVMTGCACGVECRSSSTATISGNLIQGCHGTAVTSVGSSTTITGNTIVGSSVAVRLYEASSPQVANNIIAHNVGCGISCDGISTPVLSHNDLYENCENYFGVAAGLGDIEADPQFASLQLGNLHIRPGSPCRNAGDNSAPGLLSLDIDGQPRSDSAVDIGADESLGESYPTPYPAPVIYVDAAAPLGGDGSTWETAFNSIQAAADSVPATGGAEIWIAQGTYPEAVALRPFVHLYGGFAPGDSMAGRNPSTKISAVVVASGQYAIDPSSFDTIDGLSVQGGDYTIRAHFDAPTVRNCSITGSLYGGIVCAGGQITNNVVTGCKYGYGVSFAGPARVTNNIIAHNRQYGIWANQNQTSDRGTIAGNCVIGNLRIGIYCQQDSPFITNNTIAGNVAGVSCVSGSSPTVSNNIVANNFETGISCDGTSTATLSRNDLYANASDYIGLSPGQTDISADPRLASFDFCNLHINSDSPCRNAGDLAAPGIPGTDMDGQPVPEGGIPDIGADESYDEAYPVPYVTPVVYVNCAAPAGGDGRSWAASLRTIQEGLDAANKMGGAEVWVAKGLYTENLLMQPFTYLYGGFKGTESSRDQRTPAADITTIDGGTTSPVVNIAHISTLDGFTIQGSGNTVYGYYGYSTISNNSIKGTVVAIKGALSSNHITGSFSGSGQIVGNTFTGGTVQPGSGSFVSRNTFSGSTYEGICCSSGTVIVSDNVISGCARDAIYIRDGNSDTQPYDITIANNVISDSGGYAVVADPPRLQESRLAIVGNTMNNMISLDSSSAVIQSNTLSGPNAGVKTLNAGTPKVIGNTVSGGLFGVLADDNNPTIVNNVISGCMMGIVCRRSAVCIANNTVVGAESMGLYAVGTEASGVVSNNIIASCGTYGIYANGSVVISNNDVFSNGTDYHATSNPHPTDISVDPLFVNRSAGDLRLRSDSPCIDAGTQVGIPMNDRDGSIRPQDGDGDGNIIADIGAYEYPLNLGLAKTRYRRSEAVGLGGYVVTASLPAIGQLYIEKPDRGSGIRVDAIGPFKPGDAVNLRGTLRVDDFSGECYIAPWDGWPAAIAPSVLLTPFWLSSKSLGGASLGIQSAVQNGCGANNTGLYVRVSGRVTQIDPGGSYFYTDDGAGILDGTSTGCTPNIGIRIAFDGTGYEAGQMLAISGISSCFIGPNGELQRLLKVARSTDICPVVR